MITISISASASATTLAFNANPLMRFDGYYILSDMLEIPNLRRRAAGYVMGHVKRVLLGLHVPPSEHGRRLKAILITYGLSATVYRTLLVIGIGTLLAVRVPVAGLALAAVFVGVIVISIAVRTVRYLLTSEETAARRVRAALVGVVGIIGLPALLMVLPTPGRVVAQGVLAHEGDQTLRAPSSGFIRSVHVEPGDAIEDGDLLIELEDWNASALLTEREAEVEAAAIRVQAARMRDDADLAQAQRRLAFQEAALAAQEAALARLQVRAERSGTIIDGPRQTDVGRYVYEGDAISTISSGAPIVRTLVTEEDLVAGEALVGRRVECRTMSEPGRLQRGVVIDVSPVGSRTIELESLTHIADGGIAIDEQTRQASQAYFQITIRLEDDAIPAARSGESILVRLPHQSQRLGEAMYRRFLRFRNHLRAGD